jgi:hypothetical protein
MNLSGLTGLTVCFVQRAPAATTLHDISVDALALVVYNPFYAKREILPLDLHYETTYPSYPDALLQPRYRQLGAFMRGCWPPLFAANQRLLDDPNFQ